MRSTDIHIEWNDSRDRTENMYLPSQVPVEEMSLSEARRGLCARAMGSTAACRSGCGAGCRFGRRVMELEDAGATGEASPREQRKELPAPKEPPKRAEQRKHLPVPEQAKRAEPPIRQQAAPVKTARRERPREEKWRYQAGLLIRRQLRVDMARSLMAAGMEMDKAIRAAGYASRNAYHRAARKTDEEREQHGHEAHFAGAEPGAGSGGN